MKIEGGQNLEFLLDNFDFSKCLVPHDKWEELGLKKDGFILEGASGSGKTFDTLLFIIIYCQKNINRGKRVFIFRNTYSDCRETVLEDFINILKNLGLYQDKNHTKSHPQRYRLYGNTIRFAGLENMGSHGKRNDFSYGNEGMEIEHSSFRQINQRTNEIFILDYNPCFTDHWIYDTVAGRDDVKLFNSAMLGNAFLPKGQRDEILRYEPTHPEDRALVKEKLTAALNRQKELEKLIRPHPLNVEQGTADEFMWNVYGLGMRGAMKGLIFGNVTYIDKFPEIAYVYGLDFGFTSDPTAYVKFAQEGENIYLELLVYEPIETPELLASMFEALKIEKDIPITADSSDKYISENKGSIEMVHALRRFDYQVEKVKKTNSIMFWLLKMKQKKIHIVRNNLYGYAKKEAENYRLKEINGIAINQPEDKFNHFWDASRYAFMSYNSKNSIW